MEVDGERTSAWRRRQRRLRSWLRHERQTVAMELAAALHHSRDVGPGTYAGLRAQKAASSREEVEHAQHVGPRAQKTPIPGKRPGVLKEPGAQGVAASTRYVAAAVPLLGAPRLADPAAEDFDNSAIQVFLVRVMLARANEEADEEDRRRAEEAREGGAGDGGGGEGGEGDGGEEGEEGAEGDARGWVPLLLVDAGRRRLPLVPRGYWRAPLAPTVLFLWGQEEEEEEEEEAYEKDFEKLVCHGFLYDFHIRDHRGGVRVAVPPVLSVCVSPFFLFFVMSTDVLVPAMYEAIQSDLLLLAMWHMMGTWNSGGVVSLTVPIMSVFYALGMHVTLQDFLFVKLWWLRPDVYARGQRARHARGDSDIFCPDLLWDTRRASCWTLATLCRACRQFICLLYCLRVLSDRCWNWARVASEMHPVLWRLEDHLPMMYFSVECSWCSARFRSCHVAHSTTTLCPHRCAPASS